MGWIALARMLGYVARPGRLMNQVVRGAGKDAAYDRVPELNPAKAGCRANTLANVGLVLALLASAEDESPCNERPADGGGAEERKTGIRKRLGLCGGRSSIGTRRRRDLNARDLVPVLIRGRGLRVGSASQCQEQPDDKSDVCSREQRG